MAREMLGAGLRILTGGLITICFFAYALGAVLLLPLVVLVLAVAALLGGLHAANRRLRAAGPRLRAEGPQVRAAGPQLRAAERWLRRAALTTTVHARSALGWCLSLGR
jgi:Tfp pilus assembly protein PilX